MPQQLTVLGSDARTSRSAMSITTAAVLVPGAQADVIELGTAASFIETLSLAVTKRITAMVLTVAITGCGSAALSGGMGGRQAGTAVGA